MVRAGEGLLERAVALMEESGLHGLIVYSDGMLNILHASPLRYFAGFAPMGPHAAAVVSREGKVVLLIEPASDAPRVLRHTWIGNVVGTDDIATSLVETLDALRIDGPVGLAGGRTMAYPLYEALGTRVKLQAADDLVELLASRKSVLELELVRRTASVADAGFDAFRACSRVGVREYELVAEVEYAMRCAGADDNFILVSSGPHNRALRSPTDRRLEPGDIVIGEITPACEGQFVQLCRTVVLGQPDATLIEKFGLLVRAYEAAVGRVAAGVPASVVASTIDECLTAAGYGTYCRPPYMRTRGHGFGVGSVAPGAVIDSSTNVPLLDRQVIVVHPNQYLPETGYLACGDTVLVTAAGCERLARSASELYVNEC